MFTTRPELLGTHGMVASTHWLASQCGMAILEAGGNAFDAAVASGLVLHVVEPHLNGLGGDTPIIAYSAREGRPFVVCGQGTAPQAATPEAFTDLDLDLVPGTGHLAAVVPGSFGAWLHLLERHGHLPLRDVMRAAIGYARDGYPLVPQAVATIATVEELLREHWPTSAAVYLPGGHLPQPRGRFRNTMLADTLERILHEAEAAGAGRAVQIERARQVFYEGFVAERIAEYVASTAVMDSSGEPHTGLLAYEDLATWRATEEEPAALEFQGHRVLKTPTWGQGPVLLQQLAILQGMDLDDTRPGSAELIHTVVEVAKLAFADREAFYGDPRFVDVPLDQLLSPAYAAERRALVGAVASAEMLPGSPGARVPRLPKFVTEEDPGAADRGGVGVGEPTVSVDGRTRGDTCHLDIIDRHGNLVSATPSGGWLQSSPVVPGLGFTLPTRGQIFWLEQGLPNSLEPGKRPRTTLSPGLVLRDDGSPYLAFGTPGGDQQDQWTIPFLLNHLHYGMGLQEAIDAPNWHSAHFPSSFYPRSRDPLVVHIEERVGEDVIEDLRRRGHRVNVQDGWSLGRLSAAGLAEDGMLRAAANPRGMQGYAVGR